MATKKNIKLVNKDPDFDTDVAGFTPRQMEAVRALDSGTVKFLLYGGALGGGKSRMLRWYAIRRLLMLYRHFGISGALGMLACEDYPSLKDRQLQKIETEIPGWLGKIHSDHRVYGRCFILRPKFGGGVLAFRNLDDASKYASAEFAFILVDELTKNPYEIFTFLRTRLRWPGLPDIECQFVAGTNPGSIGHGWVKQLWMDADFPAEWISPTDYRSQFRYIPSKATDNPHLDAAYWDTLNSLPEGLRKAFRDGDWDIFVGQAFPEFSKQIHVIDPVPIPDNAPLYMTYDWGFGKPFSIGWWWVDNDGRVIRFAEWYGWTGTADTGLRLADSDVAAGIIQREAEMGFCTVMSDGQAVWSRRISRLAGHDCFQKRPDYKGGGQGPSTAELFSTFGIHLTVGDPTRELKLRAFRERIKLRGDEPPMLLVYSTCAQFIRTIPTLVMDEKNIEDIETKGEDHVFDESALIAMARPMLPRQPKSILTQAERDWLRVTGEEDHIAPTPSIYHGGHAWNQKEY